MSLHAASQCSPLLTHSYTVAFSWKHNENSSGLQLLQVITLHDLYCAAKHKFQFKFWGKFFNNNLLTNLKRWIILPWNCSVSGKQLSKHHYPLSALHPHHTLTGAKWASCNAADMSRHVTLILIHTGQGSMYDANGHIWETACCFPWCAIVCINELIHLFLKHFQEHLYKTISKNTAQFGSGISLEMWVLYTKTVVEGIFRFFT